MSRAEIISLPRPSTDGRMSLERAVSSRRSHREYHSKPISLGQLSQILWAAQGITDVGTGYRAAPSPGAKFTIELYVVVKDGGVPDLKQGIFHYEVPSHSLVFRKKGDFVQQLEIASGGQEQIGQAAATIAITSSYERAMVRYGKRGIQYALQESGAVGENIYLQATAIGLGTVIMGAFDEDEVSRILDIGTGETPVLLMPVGFPSD